ncbi:Mut7-C RNAse domain-containing protein [Pontibacter sp. MBLB2868]|uniref:Mut7-C RNAse domain-containing protein n=1 Tax=Pontibacter sp. MBLB2868 TaxID=3451555 RepID=UPI003F750D87
MRHTAFFQFHESLLDFFKSSERQGEIIYIFNDQPAVKDAIEAIGVPHPEVQLILLNGKPVDFLHPLREADRVEVYPFFSPERASPPDNPLKNDIPLPARFVLDVHLGSLTRSLRMLGFDCYYERDLSDKEIARISLQEHRIVLTRDIGLLKQKSVIHGYWLRSQVTEEQLNEVMVRFSLAEMINPLTRCLVCNGVVRQVRKEDVLLSLPPKTRLYFNEFYECPSCAKVYWKGSHYDKMQQFIADLKQKHTSSDH